MDRSGVPVAEPAPAEGVTQVLIASLAAAESPRSAGEDREHVARLADMDDPLPPILVHRPTMRVIDGMHRLAAARLKGRRTIGATFFDGTAEEAFLRSVAANVAHGLPLSQADRHSAATRIMRSHPQMSDRAIARAAGLGTRTVAALRRRSGGTVTELATRMGQDGRVRPVSGVAGRQRAAEVIRERPDATLREVAQLAGVSPATAHDVRKRLRAGEPPVVSPLRPDTAGDLRDVRDVRGGRGRADRADPTRMLEKLLRDPALRHKEAGRNLLRLLRQNAIGAEQWGDLTAAVPVHCAELVGDLARQYAEIWQGFAQELAERAQDAPGDHVASE
jgi:hypothetical protein